MNLVNDEFNEGVIMEKMKKLSKQVEDLQNEDGKVDKDKLKELRYAQFIQGLKLSTGKGLRSLW